MRRPVTTVLSVAVTTALLASAVGPASASDPEPEAPDVTCAASAADSAEASTIATACARDVEVVGERTQWNTVYAQPDGTMRLDVSALAVRTDVTGSWGDIDTTVVEGDSGLTVAAPVRPMVFSDGTDGMPLARIERDGHELTFDVPFDLPAPAAEGDQITYDEVLPGVDLVVTVNDDATGFSEVLRVESPEAAADPRLAALSFPVETTDGLTLEEEAGGFVALDDAGEQVFSSPTPAMWDSRRVAPLPSFAARAARLPGASEASVDAVGGEVVDLERSPSAQSQVSYLPVSMGEDGVAITPDTGMIEDDATVWPVYIDPAISGSLNDWSAVRDVYGQSYRFNPDEGVGLCDRGTTTTCSATFRSRLLFKFGGLSSIGAMEPGHILGATFAAVGTHSYDCTPREVTAYRVDNWDSSTPWPGGANWIPQSTLVAATKSTCAGSPVRWLEFSAHEAGRAVASANSSQLTMGIAVNEGSMAWWKRFRNDAGLSISYNRPPVLPVDVKITSDPPSKCVMGAGRPYLRSDEPVLHAVLSDPDGQAVQANVDVYAAGTSNPILWHARPAAQASGVAQTIRLGGMKGANGKTFRVQINGVDPNVTGGPAVACEMTIDTQAPGAPTVAPVAVGSQPVYAADTPAGGIGKTGSFRLGPGTATDILSYKYSLNSSALDKTASGATPTIALTPTSTGSQVLYVQSVDRAGWTSPTQTFRFSVAYPTQTIWTLDETTGTTAASSDDAGTSYPLTLGGAITRVDGPMAETGWSAADRALVLGAPGATVTSARAPVVTNDSFGVQAIVRTDVVDGSATVLSQDGTATAGFDLGLRPCADGVGSCWAFEVAQSDSATAGVTRALTATKVQSGVWTLVGGALKAPQGTTPGSVSVWSCTLGTPSSDVVEIPRTQSWAAAGTFRVGATKTAGSAGWTGAVSEVRTRTGVFDTESMRRLCEPAAQLAVPTATTY
ncbi:hypothetical protein [Cellulomonas pakistanensis]|uniref:DNRLRE domain-containing protein n=1 Tax=Cellulomonas pakistanensis TaxID=992287 RepID=A0A919P823_9CELL|nr:hypothetical protein [Cellulomonas pakistanensis]GIG34833.1 hypothetical protein Cpa01nite_02140 [Cellulomonas pakistanensis]